MIDLLDPKKISIISKESQIFKSTQHLISDDLTYYFTYQISKYTAKSDDKYKAMYLNSLDNISREINRNTNFPSQLMINGKKHLFRRTKREYHYNIFKPNEYHEFDIEVIAPNSGLFVLVNLSLDYGETLYINDNTVEVNTGNNIIKIVNKGELIKINASLSEESVVVIWFTVLYEESE